MRGNRGNNDSCKASIVILSYRFRLHPRARKIASILRQLGYCVYVWESREPFQRGHRALRAIINYLFSMLDVARIKTDLYWVENVPDIVYLPLAILNKRYVYDRRSPWALHVAEEFPWFRRFIHVLYAIERFMIKRACRVIAVASTPMRLEFPYNEFGKEVVVIPNYPEKSFRCTRDNDLRERLGATKDTKVFLFIGRLSKVEGIDLLARVAIALKDTRALLWIAGDGPWRKIVEQLTIKYDHVRWLGWVPRSRLGSIIGSADYGLALFRRSSSSIFYTEESVTKLGEYIRCGLPVIASGIPKSKYYLSVEPDRLPYIVREVALGRLEVPRPPSLPLWENIGARKVLHVISVCLGS